MTSSAELGSGHQGEPLPVVPGQVLGGKFRIERVIGEGGMGIVVEATHIQLEERVALKFLRREVMQMPEVVGRFDAEARAVVKLKSEHVARVSDVGRTEDGVPYMVMELLDGKDLGAVVAEQGPLPVSEAVEYIIQACEGVGEAHARGIVHRDLKPENLFLVKRGDWGIVKVLDFGISKAVLVGPSSVDLASSNTTSIMGSPYYMSPEQLRSTKSVDHRADIWSLGVVLFELLTGGTIFDETKEFTELVADILETPHRRLTRFRKDAPADLELVIDRCLDKDRTRRFQNVAELAIALLPFAPRRSRVTAERTTSIAKAAGLITDPNFQMPPSNYPAARASGPAGSMYDATLPPMAPLPTFSSQPALSGPISGPISAPVTAPVGAIVSAPPSGPISAPILASPSNPSLPGGEVPAAIANPAENKPKSRTPLLIGLILLLGGITIFLLFFNHRPEGTATDGNAQPNASASVAAKDPTPPPSDSGAASAAASASQAVASSKPANNGGHGKVPGYIAKSPTTSTGTSTSTPAAAHPSLDIQMER
jgi:serine/threonine-protein kinase